MNIGVREETREELIQFSEDNPDCSVLPLDNGRVVVSVGDTPLNLSAWDFGMGVAVLRLYRGLFYRGRLERTANFLTECGPQKSYERLYRDMSKLLDQLHFPLTAWDKREIKTEAGVLNGSSAFLKIMKDDRSSYPWMLLGTGCPILTGMIANGSCYERVEDQLEDLKMLQKYARMNRKLAALRFSELYYGAKTLEDIAFEVRDRCWHGVDAAGKKLYLFSTKGLVKDCQGEAFRLVYQFQPQ